ncbi:MAG: DUF6484 domain-containing protein [Polyangiaceae bacterium]
MADRRQEQVSEVELTADDSADNEEGGDAAAFDRLLELVTSPQPAVERTIPERIVGVVIGRLVALGGGPQVSWAGAPRGTAAKSLVPLSEAQLGREVALMFEEQDPSRPLVTGVVERFEPALDGPEQGKLQVTVEAPDELVLRAGAASITLTRAGKILIRGAYVSSTATGTNRIRGGTVEIN